jgi:asparagine synthetase B (glutamine-hydrolysing)
MSHSTYDRFCVSSYLAFRYVVRPDLVWKDGVPPRFPQVGGQSQIRVRDSSQILATLRTLMRASCESRSVGILLSSGIDSAILAALMPPGSDAYTIRFAADRAVDETVGAGRYARRWGLNLHVVDVTWSDYLDLMPGLFRTKKSPLHPVEVGLFKAASRAASDGVHDLVIGNGADSTFGGLDKLLSRDWTFDEFVKRYTFIEPQSVVREPVSMRPVYEHYRLGDGIDVIGFLKLLHGTGVIQAFDHAIGAAGCKTIEPYERLVLDAPLDLERIRKGESKYLLREVFEQLYGDLEIPRKIAFARPMDQWMKDWEGPRRPEFRDDLDMERFSGDQKYLMFCLESFMNCFDLVSV